MDIENINENLIEKKCYICFDPCDTKSPCNCDTYVHMVCLIQFAKKNNKNIVSCTICKQNIKEIKELNKKYNKCSILIYFLLLFVYYFLGLISIMFFTHYILDYDIILYIEYRINIIIHMGSILLGYVEFRLLLLILTPCINYIRNNYVIEN
tara:strand:+ start:335 stop:790 length:456 start_codon:yes stop_codon:yes gene_type:complete